MKNHFKSKDCDLTEEEFLKLLEYAIDHKYIYADFNLAGWMYNYVKDLESKITGNPNPNPGGADPTKRIDVIEAKVEEIASYIKDLPGKLASSLDVLSEELKKQNQGIIYLKKEIDAIKTRLPPLSDPSKPDPGSVPTTPSKPEPPAAPVSSKEPGPRVSSRTKK